MIKKCNYDECNTNGNTKEDGAGKLVSEKENHIGDELRSRREKSSLCDDESEAKINAIIEYIIEEIKKCDPLMLMKAVTDFSMSQLMQDESEVEMIVENSNTLHLIEYTQSILTSVIPESIDIDEETQSEIWFKIFDSIEALYAKCQRFLSVWAEQELQRIQYSREDTEKLVSSHSDRFMQLYKLSDIEFMEGLKKLEYSLSSAKLDSLSKLIKKCEEFQDVAEEKSLEEVDMLISQIRDSEYTADFLEKFFSADLYDVKKVTGWSDELIKGFSWKIGENDSFLGRAEFPGWPIQDLPTKQRPFIRIGAVSYCFDHYHLYDNFYRLIKERIMDLSKTSHT